MSAGGDGARSAALKAGASVFLDKPVRLREVVATMRQLLSV
jgi:DNA-binding response OmpR family regulator